ncbi:hypothetical protein KZP23_03685 [Echinicola marina]|uniref:hypothetical protein n=1 Tax=Echinicola marina TaxID=2859768 RepID=UPI001CF6EE5D|nr:hypothetical protein [Echinicola marina]UCS94145.1 hypothetical protein KZP23_03685 [Echinicola marina]
MRPYCQLNICCFFILLVGCNNPLSKTQYSENQITYNLIVTTNNEHQPEHQDEVTIGKVLLTPDKKEQVFKIKTIISHTIKTSGYQVFVNGESNYQLLDYNTSYFCIGNATDPKAIKIRIRIDEELFITAKLSGTNSYVHTENKQIAGPELFPKRLQKLIIPQNQ